MLINLDGATSRLKKSENLLPSSLFQICKTVPYAFNYYKHRKLDHVRVNDNPTEYGPLCMTKTYLLLRFWGLKKSRSSNSTRSLRPFDAMKVSATLRVAGRSWTIYFLIFEYLISKTGQLIWILFIDSELIIISSTWLAAIKANNRAFLDRLLHQQLTPSFPFRLVKTFP
jgi:hypothetical protein